jgi:hypothetical protein
MIPERLMELWEDLRCGVGRALRRLGGGDAGDPQRVFRLRRRIALVAAVLALAAVYLFVPVPGLPCEASPAKTCVPADDAIALVPADAAAYLHLNLDRDSSQFTTTKEVLAKLPHAGQIEQGLLRSLGLAPGLTGDDFESWIGDEAAFAALGPDARQRLVLLSVRNEKGAS